MSSPREGGERAGKAVTEGPQATVAGVAMSAGDGFSGSRCLTLLALERDVFVGSSHFPARIRISSSGVFSLLPLCQMKSFYFMVVSALESACCLCRELGQDEQSTEAGFISLGN